MTACPSQQDVWQSLWDLAQPLADCEDLGHSFRVLDAPHDLLAQLTGRYDDYQLLEAQVVEKDAAGSLTLNEMLVAPKTTLCAVHDARRGLIDLVTEKGALSGNLPAVAMSRDRRLILDLRQSNGILFLVHRFEDVIWHRAVGLPAVLCPDVELLDFAMLWQVRRQARRGLLGPRRPPPHCAVEVADGDDAPQIDPEVPDSDPSPLLVLSGWFAASGDLTEPIGLRERVALLALTRRYLSTPVGEVCLWAPNPEDLAAFGCLRALGDTTALRAAMLTSVEQIGRAIDSLSVADVPYITARQQYRAAVEQSRLGMIDEGEVRRAREIFTRAVERELVEPLLAKSAQCASAERRLLYLALAELPHELQAAVLAAQQNVGDAISGRFDGPDSRRLSSVIKQMLSIQKLLNGN